MMGMTEFRMGIPWGLTNVHIDEIIDLIARSFDLNMTMPVLVVISGQLGIDG